MTTQEATQALREIQLALLSNNNCIATDMVDAKEDETHWRIDNTEAIESTRRLEKALIAAGICLQCADDNTAP